MQNRIPISKHVVCFPIGHPGSNDDVTFVHLRIHQFIFIFVFTFKYTIPLFNTKFIIFTHGPSGCFAVRTATPVLQ